ncbi:MAG: hypothetical protein LAP13_05175 [Acidobacteriia bacterium]|nr:hypothetical protein [Terriglobia bacterium]
MLLTPEHVKAIEAELEGKGTYPILILYAPNDWERQSEKLSLDFEGLLSKLGWTVERKSWWDFLQVPEDQKSKPRQFFIGEREPTMPSRGAVYLLAALKRAKFPIAERIEPFLYDPEKRCCLFIGAQPLATP